MDLKTRYMGLELANPLIVGSSGITQSVDGVQRCAAAGAGAVVLKSIFEEQLVAETADALRGSQSPTQYPEAEEYLERYGRELAFDRYLKLIREAKQAVSIPVIASIHCSSAGAWTEFAGRVQQAGADALELNVFVLPSDARRDARDYEQQHFDIASAVRRHVSIPLALKIGSHFSGLARTAVELSRQVDALVLFNRFYRVDFDIDNLQLVPADLFSTPDEIALPLRWISILEHQVDCDLAASGGVHDGAGVVKQLLAGAAAVQVCSALYRNRTVDHLRTMLDQLQAWMQRQGFTAVRQFRGKLSQKSSKDPAAYERVQFMVQTADRPLT